MAYLARQDIIYNGATFHITWQCHNGSWFLKAEDTKQLYYDLLLKYKGRYGVDIYSYCFMSNHPHMTGRVGTVEGLSRLMQAVNSQFAKVINKILTRRGQVVMDRFKSPIIQTDRDLLKVMTYVDLNPNRARMVIHPKEYRWSSYKYYAHGKSDPLITPAPSYLALGNTPVERQTAYQNMVNAILSVAVKKENYSRTACIGNPDWVKQRCVELKEIQRAKRIAYLYRQRQSLYGRASPS